jgi:hypothetical protein
MAIPEIDKHKEYVRYAEHCLKTATVITYQKSRAILREMAAEWLTLADAVPRSRPHQIERFTSLAEFRACPRGAP